MCIKLFYICKVILMVLFSADHFLKINFLKKSQENNL